MTSTPSYPATPSLRDRWVLERRPPRNVLDPWRPYAFFRDRERENGPGPGDALADVATVLLTNRECPWRCVMCDLWRNTLEGPTPEGAVAEQVRYALEELGPMPPGGFLKLYNAGSFFDERAIPRADRPAIARLASPFSRVVVECHPSLVGQRCLEFRDRLAGRLEIALGLETAHPEVLERLNKRMTLETFRRAAEFLARNEIDLRAFILVRPPWLSESEGVEWAKRSLDFAFDQGARVCVLIPTRAGNGAMEALAASGAFAPPRLTALEAALEHGLRRSAGRVFVDLWDIEALRDCPECSERRIARLRAMNDSQTIGPPVDCPRCAEDNDEGKNAGPILPDGKSARNTSRKPD